MELDFSSLLQQSLNSKLTTMLLQRMYQSSTATNLAVPDSTRRAFASQMRVDAHDRQQRPKRFFQNRVGRSVRQRQRYEHIGVNPEIPACGVPCFGTPLLSFQTSIPPPRTARIRTRAHFSCTKNGIPARRVSIYAAASTYPPADDTNRRRNEACTF